MLINCDLGECLIPNPDTDIMPLIDMANIACGGHIGDDQSMVDTIRLAQKNNIKIGAHPSYADRENFGRLSHSLSDNELYELIHTQVSHFQNLCYKNNATLKYIKPHGALYHDMTHNEVVLKVMCSVIHEINADLSLVIQAGNEDYFKNFGNNTNVNFSHEVFADRGYIGSHIIPRGEKSAVLTDENTIINQYRQFLTEKPFKIDTICFHGDNPASVEALKRLKHA